MHRPVPVTTGSPVFTTLETGPFRITEARFPSNSALEPHVHERHVCAVILDGSFDDCFPHQVLECTPHTVLVEPAVDRHSNQFGKHGARVLIVEPDPVADDLLHPCRALFESARSFSDPQSTRIAHRLSRELYQQDDLSPLAIEALVLDLFVQASRHVMRDAERDRVPPWLKYVVEYLNEYYRKPIRLSEVAAVAGVHPTHLARSFRTCCGVTIGRYVRELRLAWAAHAIRASDTPVAQIAMRAGFSDQPHFTREFKKEFGSAPAQYRRTTKRT